MERDGVPQGRRGNSQYGSLTRAAGDLFWNGATWIEYRAVRSEYYPYTSTGKYLVGLPAYQNVYDCVGGTYDYQAEDLVSSVLYLYDEHSTYWTQPSLGKLTRKQRFVCFADSGGELLRRVR